MEPDDPCPFCDPRGLSRDDPRAARWTEAGQLCGRHRASARLPSGDLLLDYVRSCPFQLEGSLLQFVLNPLTVDGRPAWSLWHSSYGVWAELFRSDDVVEFAAQHMDDFVPVLRDLHDHRDIFRDGVTIHTFMRYAEAVRGTPTIQRLQRLLDLATIGARYTPLRRDVARALPPPSELVDRMHAVGPGPPADPLEPVRALLALGERRFDPR